MSLELINAKDRIPVNVLSNGAIRYGRYDANGNLLGYEYMKREDEPIEEGTNINKVLLDLIDNNFLTEQAERMRVDRYNIPEYELFSLEETIIQGDIIPKTWTQVTAGLKYINGDISIEGSSYFSTTRNIVPNACNNNETDYWQSGQNTNQTFLIDFMEPKKINKMKTYITVADNSSYLDNWKIQGSNDNLNWTDLFISNSVQTRLSEVILSNVDWYRYYRIVINLNTSYYVRIYEVQTSEYYERQYGNLLSLKGNKFNKITEYENNSIVNVQIPDTVVLYEKDIIPKTWTYVADNHWNSGNFEIFGTFSVVSNTVNNAVDGDLSTKGAAGMGTGDFTIKFDKARKITKFNTFITAFGSNTWKIQGSNDNSSWVDLLEVNGSDSGLTEHILNNPNYYLYYRFYQGYYFYEIQTKEYEGTFELDPNNPSYLSINNLEPKEIVFADTPAVGSKYQVVYNGTNFKATSYENEINKIKSAIVALGGSI